MATRVLTEERLETTCDLCGIAHTGRWQDLRFYRHTEEVGGRFGAVTVQHDLCLDCAIVGFERISADNRLASMRLDLSKILETMRAERERLGSQAVP